MAWPICGKRAVKYFCFPFLCFLLIQVLLKRGQAHIFKNMGNCEFPAQFPVMGMKGAVSAGTDVWKR